jgi:hypothetical protein
MTASPRARHRDPVSAIILCVLQQASTWQGAFLAYNLYHWLGGPGGRWDNRTEQSG